MKRIKPKNVLFIKLGRTGKYEGDCIEKDNNLRLSYKDINHSWCTKGQWESVHSFLTDVKDDDSGVATRHTNQIKQFYEEDEHTLWITFYANKLWWCYSKPVISLESDKTKTRPVIGKWHDKDIQGKLLSADNISGKLFKIRSFQGTICKVHEINYILAKINGEQLKEAKDVEEAMSALRKKVSKMIQHLQWQDFETLTEMIFSRGGWQRIGQTTSKTEKTIDLDLIAPITEERAIVQIKSSSDKREFEKYQKEFLPMNYYHKFFYVVNNPKPNLLKYKNDSDIQLLFRDKIAELTIGSGFTEWVIKRAS